jgi:hypothetical protein
VVSGLYDRCGSKGEVQRNCERNQVSVGPLAEPGKTRKYAHQNPADDEPNEVPMKDTLDACDQWQGEKEEGPKGESERPPNPFRRSDTQDLHFINNTLDRAS